MLIGSTQLWDVWEPHPLDLSSILFIFAYHSYIYLINLSYTTYFYIFFFGCKLKFKKDVYSIRTYIHICKSHSEVQNQIIEIMFDN